MNEQDNWLQNMPEWIKRGEPGVIHFITPEGVKKFVAENHRELTAATHYGAGKQPNSLVLRFQGEQMFITLMTEVKALLKKRNIPGAIDVAALPAPARLN
jgi:hypothetical protein